MSETILKEEKYQVLDVTMTGLGYGEGSISLDARTGLPDSDPMHVSEILWNKVDDFMHSNKALVPVDSIDDCQLDDDGCGDGRATNETFVMDDGEKTVKKRSLHRAKVFGGSPVMAGAALVAAGEETDTITDAFFAGIDTLKAHRVDFGGHTDNHASGDKSGCGAIDNAPRIVENIQNYKSDIIGSLQTLGVATDSIDNVFESFDGLKQRAASESYAGTKVMDRIKGERKVVKELDGDHREIGIVINTVEGYTVDQEAVRQLTDRKMEVFAVDLWRITDLAERLFPEDDAAQTKALQGMLVYTLATAATLTDGSLPVWLMKQS